MQRATIPGTLPIGGSRHPRVLAGSKHLSRRSAAVVVVAAAGKRPSSKDKGGGGGGGGGTGLPPRLASNLRAEGDLSDRERALLAAALRDSQLQQQQQQQSPAAPRAKKARAPGNKGFAGVGGAGAAAAASGAAAPPSSSSSPSPARPINPREAARGRVELVNVRSWDGGSAAEAGDLEIVSVRTLVGGAEDGQKKQSGKNKPGERQEGEAAAATGGDAAASAAATPPLHVALAQQLQLAEARGALSIASSTAAKPLPPFEQWSFSPASYAQYLADHAEAHAALDDAVDGVVAAAAAGAAAATTAAGGTTTTAARCLRWFARERGIARGDAYASDLRAMVASMAEEQQQQQPPAPSNGAAALARLLRRLGRDAALEAASGSSADDDGAGDAVLKLAAHAYALRAAHLSGSGRITAAAQGRLDLARRGALAAVARYGGGGGGGAAASSLPPPPARFSADVDAYGREMTAAMVAGDGDDDPYAWAGPLFAELPSAFRKASALLDGLATTEGGG